MYGFALYGFDVYGGVISRAEFIYFIPDLIVNRGATTATINVSNPTSNGDLVILRSDDYIGTFTTRATVAVSSLPYVDSINNELSHKYKARFVYSFNGNLISDAPSGAPIYTTKPNGEL